MRGNYGFDSTLLERVREHGNTCPVMLASSQQASLTGRFGDSEYGRSKKAGEELFLKYGDDTGAKVLVYRFPNLFGKWCRPNYNSVVATFCHNTANGLPIRVDDETKQLHLAYVDDAVDEIITCVRGLRQPGGGLSVPITYYVTLGRIAELIRSFKSCREELTLPDVSDPFTKKLYSTYLSYVPAGEAAVPCDMKRDERGSFTELLRTEGMGQVSVNVCRPGFTKGNHWHHTKTERFIVVSGAGVIRQRRVGEAEVTEIPVSGEEIRSVDMLPGYTHSIENTGEEDLVFIIWANERFDPERPDTFFEKVIQED